MAPKQLQLSDGTPVDACMCSVCKLVYAGANNDVAERCCTCLECGCELPPTQGGIHRSVCDGCNGPRRERIDRELLERATEVLDYDGPVWNGCDYFRTLEDYIEHIECDGGELPEFVHTCSVEHYTLDADDIVERMIESVGVREDFGYDDFNGMDELRAAVKAFNEANANQEAWDADVSKKVRVRPAAIVPQS